MRFQVRKYWSVIWWAVIIVLALKSGGREFTGRTLAAAPLSPPGVNNQQQLQSDAAPQDEDAQNSDSNNIDPWYSTKVEKQKLKLMLGASIVIVIGFFVAVLLLSLLRMGRLHRQRSQIGKKRQQTDYVDAWSQYRLKDGWDKELPDDSDQSGN